MLHNIGRPSVFLKDASYPNDATEHHFRCIIARKAAPCTEKVLKVPRMH